MPLFLAVGRDHPPHNMELRDKLRKAHRRYVMIDRSEPVRFAGPMVDDEGNQCGTVYIFEADHVDDVWAWLRTEPFYVGDVYASMDVSNWQLGYNGFDRLPWPQLPAS